MSSFIKDNSVGALGGSSFSVGDVDGKFSVGPRTTYLNSQNFDCWIGSGSFVPCNCRYHSSMSHSYKYRFYSLSNISSEDYYGASGDIRGGVDSMKNGLYFQNDKFGRDRNYVGFM